MRWGLALFSIATVAACHSSRSEDASSSGAPPPPDAPSATIATYAPSATNANGPRANATWAAYAGADDVFHALAPTAAGTYLVPLAPRWSVVLVCASDDAQSSSVLVYRRTDATTALDVTLASWCTPPVPPDDGAIRGTLSNLPASTTWLDFGYARDWRGTALPVTGTSASYEIVNVAQGAWDLAFGVRDDSAGPYTRMILRRGEVLDADKQIDVDLSGPGSFVPGTKALAVHGLVDGESTRFAVFYAMGNGAYGIDVAPQDIPAGPDVTTAVSTIPPELQQPGDRYRGSLVVSHGSDRPSDSRTIEFEVHDAIDLDVTLPASLPPPDVRVVDVARYLRTTTSAPLAPGAVTYEIVATAQEARRELHEWRTSYDLAAAGSGIADTTPDLGAIPGWNDAWAIGKSAAAKVDLTASEAKVVLGDGTLVRSTMASAIVTP
jgi:hypothetical protein